MQGKKRVTIKITIFEEPFEDWRGTGLDKDEGVLWILVIGLVIFAIASFFIYSAP